MTDYLTKYLQMSLEQVELIDESNIQRIFDICSEELARRTFLWERYNREEYLRNYLNADEEERKKMSIIASFENVAVNTAAGYFVGKPVSYYNTNYTTVKTERDYRGQGKTVLKENAEQKKKLKDKDFLPILLDILNENNEKLHNINLAQDTSDCTTAIEKIWVDSSNKKINFGILDPTEIVTIYDNSIKPQLIGCIRKVETTNYIENKKTVTYELETPKRYVAYDFTDGNVVIRGLAKDIKGNPIVEKMGELAKLGMTVLEYPMPERIGVFEQQVPLIAEYERVQTSTKELLKHNAHSAKLALGGVEAPTKEDGETIDENKVEDLLKSDVLFGGDNPEGSNFAKWLTKLIDDNPIEHHKKSLKADIFGGIGMPDPSEAATVYENYAKLQYKFFILEQKISELEQIYREKLLHRAKIICMLYNKLNNTSYSVDGIRILFERNLPLNKIEEANLLGQYWNKRHPINIFSQMASIENPEEEYAQYRRFLLEDAELQARMATIMAKATADVTENDILPKKNSQEVQNGTV